MNPNDAIPPEMLSRNASNDMMLFTCFLSLLIAGAMIFLGIKGKQIWMVFWSVGLILMSLFAGSAIIFDIDYFNLNNPAGNLNSSAGASGD